MNSYLHNATLFKIEGKILVTETKFFERETKFRPYHWVFYSGQIELFGQKLVEQHGLPEVQDPSSEDVAITTDFTAANRLLIGLKSFIQKKLSSAELFEESCPIQIRLQVFKRPNGAYLRIYRQVNMEITDQVVLNLQEAQVLERTVADVLRTAN